MTRKQAMARAWWRQLLCRLGWHAWKSRYRVYSEARQLTGHITMVGSLFTPPHLWQVIKYPYVGKKEYLYDTCQHCGKTWHPSWARREGGGG